MRQIWALGLIYICIIVCGTLAIITTSTTIHQVFLEPDAHLMDKAVTTFLQTGDPTAIAMFTPAEQSHLQDVRELLGFALAIVWAGTVILLSFWLYLEKKEQFAILFSPFLFVFYIAPLVLITDFTRSFFLFHQIFFPQGNYAFPMDSLLISTYPQVFFVKMALVAGIIILLLSSLKLFGWKLFCRKSVRKNKKVTT